MNLKKSILDYAIKGSLTTGFRRENPSLNAKLEILAFNKEVERKREKIKKEIAFKEDEIKKLESKIKELNKKAKDSTQTLKDSALIETNAKELQDLKEKIRILKKDSLKLKVINIENMESQASLGDKTPFKIPPSWAWVRLGDIQINIEKENIKISKNDYLPNGLYPIISQEKEFISGYTNLTNPIVDLPIIIFGDHTCNLKYIDFPFFQGADGVKLIKPLEAIFVKYLYYFLQSLEVAKDKYTRHYKFIKDLLVPLPSLKEQQEIVRILESLMGLADEYEDIKEELKRI